MLQRRRDDLSAAEEADTPAASPTIYTSGLHSDSPDSGEEVKSLVTSPSEQASHTPVADVRAHGKKTSGIGRIDWRDSTALAAGRTGRGSGGVRAGSRPSGRSLEQEEDAAQADEVAHEIASMAGKLKESSMAINQTLRTQTKVGLPPSAFMVIIAPRRDCLGWRAGWRATARAVRVYGSRVRTESFGSLQGEALSLGGVGRMRRVQYA